MQHFSKLALASLLSSAFLLSACNQNNPVANDTLHGGDFEVTYTITVENTSGTTT